MLTLDPTARQALIDDLSGTLTAPEVAALDYLAADDPLLFVAEMVASHQRGRINLDGAQVRRLRSLLAEASPAPAGV